MANAGPEMAMASPKVPPFEERSIRPQTLHQKYCSKPGIGCQAAPLSSDESIQIEKNIIRMDEVLFDGVRGVQIPIKKNLIRMDEVLLAE